MQTQIMKSIAVFLLFAGLQVCAMGTTYTPGDTWLLEGATDWTNSPHFFGLGNLQSTDAPDTNKVWRFMQYDDFWKGELFDNPAELNILADDANGTYRSKAQLPAYMPSPWVSDFWIALDHRTYGGRSAGAVVWESPMSGTFQIDADLVYTGGVGTVSYGVFYHDVSGNDFYQIQKGILYRLSAYGWEPITSAVVQASVSLNAGDRLVFLQRGYVPSDGYDWVYTTGPTGYALRRCEHRNLTVTFLSSDQTNSVPASVRTWRRKDLHWRADVEDSLKAINGGTAVVKDRRVPQTLPVAFQYYVSTNQFMGHTEVNATGLMEGETLSVAKQWQNFFGDYASGCREHLLYYRHNHHYTDVRAKPAVWVFRPPKPGVYSIVGLLEEQSDVVNSLGSTSYWLGTVVLDNFGTNPVVSRIETLSREKLVRNTEPREINLRCQLESTNHCIYMTIWGEVSGGDRRSSVVDDLLITFEYGGTLLTIR